MIMSGTRTRKSHAPSTAESLRMASVSVLTATTKKGVPLGNAIGLGSMMEENSETVAMNIAPIIFGLRYVLLTQEGLDLLSMQWNLDAPSSARVLPEQLLVAGGSSGGVFTNACVLTWERGVVDAFKIDDHMNTVSRKLADIELAIENNQLDYDQYGVQVLRRFTDRLNRVTFVDMMDRRFQGSWDSVQLKIDQVDVECEVTAPVVENFAVRPPGLQTSGNPHLRFLLPNYDESLLLEHFKHRILIPSSIEILTERIPEAGRAILAELNSFAYSIEEAAAMRVLINGLISFVGTSSVTPENMNDLIVKGEEYASLAVDALGVFEELAEQHIGSGKSLLLSGHEEEFNLLMQMRSSELTGIKGFLVKAFFESLMDSLRREFPQDKEIRAWQLKSSIRYFVAYANRAVSNFSQDFNRFLIISITRKVLISALRDLKNRGDLPELDAIDQTLFNKIYDELHSQLNALFARHAFKGDIGNPTLLLNSIADEIIKAFQAMDVWSLVDFSDIAEIARTELKRMADDSSLLVSPDELSNLLTRYEHLVQEVIPDVARTLLSRDTINRVIDGVLQHSGPFMDQLTLAVEAHSDRSGPWVDEATNWVSEFEEQVDTSLPVSQQLLEFVRFVHEKLNTARGTLAVVEKVKSRTDELEQEHARELREWEAEYKRISAENERAGALNAKREEMLREAREKFEREQQEYNSRVASGEVSPTPPEPLESRIARIDRQYPEQRTQPLPQRPEPSKELLLYRQLRTILTERIEKMNDRRKSIEDQFANLLAGIKDKGLRETTDVTVDLNEEFFDYLLDDVLRGLSHVFPYITRVYLCEHDDPSVMYLVAYERKAGELKITIGNTFLRGER